MINRRDPDPATIIFGMVGVTSLVIQLVDMYARTGRRESIALVRKARFDTLTRLQSSARQVSIAINDLLMAASYGSKDVDAELFDAPIGVSTGQLWLDQLTKPTFDGNVAEFYAAVSALSRWINHTITHNPDVAEELGMMLSTPLSSMADKLNRSIREARSNRDIIDAARQTLDAFQDAVGKLLSRKQ